jgi:hypothetical protein
MPEYLTKPNWIFFTEGNDFATAVDDVIEALETDLEWRDAKVLAGNAIFTCDACGSLAQMQSIAASRLAWSHPLWVKSDTPPSSNPYF